MRYDKLKLYAQHLHQQRHPWASAPPWALELGAMLHSLMIEQTESKQREIAMSITQDRANQALTNITNAGIAVQTMIAQLTATIRDTQTDDPKVIAALDHIDEQSAAIAAAALANTKAAAEAPSPGTPLPQAQPIAIPNA